MMQNENADAANVGASETPETNHNNYTAGAVGQQWEKTPAIIYGFSEFMATEFLNGEVIAFEIRRRELALVSSITNAGKSTLVRNVLLALATGSEFLPLAPMAPPRRVLLIDFESSASRLQDDLATMTRDWPAQKMAQLTENFYVTSECMIDDNLLSLSNHMGLIEGMARQREVDLIVIDTACAGFDLRDENNNSEVSRVVLKPLLRLARLLNCAVVLLHHVGKARSEEGQARELVHKPRGASSFSGYAVSVFVLDADGYDPNAVTLSCAKRKSGAAYSHTLTLNRDTRWFACAEEIQRKPTDYELVRGIVLAANGVVVKRNAINAALTGKVSERTITRHLKSAVERGEIVSPKKGFYCANSGNGQSATAI